MKAQERKHLEQNELAARLSEWWNSTRDKKSSAVWWAVLGVAVLAVIAYFAWSYYASAALKNRSEQWRDFDSALESSQFEQLVETNKGTDIALGARAQIARGKMLEGMNKFGSELQHQAAIDLILQARGLYEELAKDAAKDRVLLTESLFGIAKAEETLVSATKENSTASLGSLDKALELYQSLADKYPETVAGKDAADRAKDIRENKAKILAFYQELTKRYARAEAPKLPEFPKPEPPKTPSPEPVKPITPVEPPKKEAPKVDGSKDAPMIKPVEPPKPAPEVKKDGPKVEPAPAPKKK